MRHGRQSSRNGGRRGRGEKAEIRVRMCLTSNIMPSYQKCKPYAEEGETSDMTGQASWENYGRAKAARGLEQAGGGLGQAG